MIKIYLIFLLINSSIINGKSTLKDEDPNTDYIFHDEGSGDVSNASIELSTLKAETHEMEDSFETSKNYSILEQSENSSAIETSKSNETITVQSLLSSLCTLDAEELRAKVSDIMQKYVPSILKLKPINRGSDIRLILYNGRLSVNTNFKIMGQPVCEQIDDQIKNYDFMVSFEDLVGFYDWKIYNLFGNDFSESAILSIKQLRAEFVFVEDNKEKTRLKEVKVGAIDGLDVKVNVPENITQISLIKQMMQYVISRITTMIVNRSKDSIIRNMENILSDAIREKSHIRP